MSTLYIVRGLPGSGKSTLAKEIAIRIGADHWEADQYFVDSQGNYKWDGSKIGEAHDQCETNFVVSLQNNRNVVVSNTFTKLREFRDYIQTAQDYKYDVIVVECLNSYGSIHNVPEASMLRMLNRWEPNKQLKEIDAEYPMSQSLDWEDITLMNSDEFHISLAFSDSKHEMLSV